MYLKFLVLGLLSGFLFEPLLAQEISNEEDESVEFSLMALALKERIDECKCHLDVRPFLYINLDDDLSELDLSRGELADFMDDQRSIALRGEIELTEAQKADPEVVACARFAEGLYVGTVFFALKLAIEAMTTSGLEALFSGMTLGK